MIKLIANAGRLALCFYMINDYTNFNKMAAMTKYLMWKFYHAGLMAGLVFGLAGSIVGPARAAEISSQYTRINFSKCTTVSRFEMHCPSRYFGYIYVAEGDLRYFIGFGKRAKQQKLASQTLSAFNLISKGKKPAVLEWRVRQVRGRWQPFATILRYYTESGESSQIKGQVLVISTLQGGDACHVGYVDVKQAGAQANLLARRVADEIAPRFNCERDEPVYFTARAIAHWQPAAVRTGQDSSTQQSAAADHEHKAKPLRPVVPDPGF